MRAAPCLCLMGGLTPFSGRKCTWELCPFPATSCWHDSSAVSCQCQLESTVDYSRHLRSNIFPLASFPWEIAFAQVYRLSDPNPNLLTERYQRMPSGDLNDKNSRRRPP